MNCISLKFVSCCLIALGFVFNCQAQSKDGRITGYVLDSTEKKAVAFVTVRLFKKNQPGQPLKAVYSDAKGKFRKTDFEI